MPYFVAPPSGTRLQVAGLQMIVLVQHRPKESCWAIVCGAVHCPGVFVGFPRVLWNSPAPPRCARSGECAYDRRVSMEVGATLTLSLRDRLLLPVTLNWQQQVRGCVEEWIQMSLLSECFGSLFRNLIVSCEQKSAVESPLLSMRIRLP